MEFHLKNLIFVVIFLIAFGFFIRNVIRLINYLKLGQGENRTDNIPKRLWLTLKVAIFQTKILREASGGTIHAWIFWGFLILLFAASNAVFTGFGIQHFYNFLGPIYSAITFLIDLFCILIIIAVVWALLRRYIFKVKRLQVEGEKFEAGFILFMIFVIVSSLLIENATAIVMQSDASNAYRPISASIAVFIPLEHSSIMHEISFWVHILFILAFMNYLPYSKHLHVLTSIPNVFLGSLTPVNKLKPINFEAEGVEKFGVVDFEDLTWKQILDGYTCTHCGRCTSVCPANTTGKKLDPREIVMQIRHRTFDKAPILLKQKKNIEISENEKAILEKKFIGEYESIDALWQCTTCAACMQECPVMIEHVPAIIDMRRSLVMMEANFPTLLQNAFGNLETNATPWAFSQADRARWAEDLGIKQASEHPDFDVLFWVGCAGSYDDRAIKISRAFATLLQKAGVNFAILGTEEQCTGDVARRAGNEYLADMLMKANVETLNRYNVKKIVTICPHCFNTLKNEYPDFGGKFEVIHHTEFLLNLINEGKLKLKPAKDIQEIAYHDSCYLGRYNEIYDKPRILLSKAGYQIKEVARAADRGFCCGAGGAQMFMEETVGKRVNIERTEELLETGCSQIAVNCPFCTTMITDGTKAKEAEDVKVRDIAEILLDCVE